MDEQRRHNHYDRSSRSQRNFFREASPDELIVHGLAWISFINNGLGIRQINQIIGSIPAYATIYRDRHGVSVIYQIEQCCLMNGTLDLLQVMREGDWSLMLDQGQISSLNGDVIAVVHTQGLTIWHIFFLYLSLERTHRVFGLSQRDYLIMLIKHETLVNYESDSSSGCPNDFDTTDNYPRKLPPYLNLFLSRINTILKIKPKCLLQLFPYINLPLSFINSIKIHIGN